MIDLSVCVVSDGTGSVSDGFESDHTAFEGLLVGGGLSYVVKNFHIN